MGTFTRKFISELLPLWLSRKAFIPSVKKPEADRLHTSTHAPLRPKPVTPFRPKPEPTDRRSSHM